MGKSSNGTFSEVAKWIFAISMTLVIVVALVHLLVHISNSPSHKEEVQAVPPLDLPMVERNEVRDLSGGWAYRISKVKFSGHTYIVVEDHGTAMLHDPDCECNLKN